MTAVQLAVLAIAAFLGLASAEFPLVWVCLGLTVVGIAIALYVAYRRPMEPYSPEAPAAEPFEEDDDQQPSQVRSQAASQNASPKSNQA